MISTTQKLSTFILKKVNSVSWSRELRHQLSARQCLLCCSTHHGQRSVCAPCLNDLPWLSHTCSRCGVQIKPNATGRICASCLKRPPPYDHCEGLFHYEFPVQAMISELKFHKKTWYAGLFGDLLSDRIKQRHPDMRPDLILPTPIHHTRLRQRGFNQALEIARIISRRTGTPLDYRTLIKRKATKAQSELAAKERVRNLHQSFGVRHALPGKHILLVDDVVTTGHTVSEISRVLRLAGASRIDVLCVARTPPPKSD